MKRIYLTTKVNAGSSQIKVRQIAGKGSKDVTRRVGRISSTAQGWVRQVLPELRSVGMSDATKRAFTACFRANPSSMSLSTIRAVLTTTLSGMSKPHGVKVRADNDAYGYVTSYYAGRIHLISGMQHIDEDGDTVARKGEIHLDTGMVKSDMTMSAITYLHEATHRFANTDDHGDQGYFKANGSRYEANGLAPRQALINADSYAYFVYKTLQGKFTSVICT